jgi:hypothetical protein
VGELPGSLLRRPFGVPSLHPQWVGREMLHLSPAEPAPRSLPSPPGVGHRPDSLLHRPRRSGASLTQQLSSGVGLTRHPAVSGLKWTSCPFAPWTSAALGGSLNGSQLDTRRRVLRGSSQGREMLCLSPVREPPQKWAGPGGEWTGRPFEAARYTDVSEADPRGSRFLRAVPQGPVQRDSSAVAPVPSGVIG